MGESVFFFISKWDHQQFSAEYYKLKIMHLESDQVTNCEILA